ncbi:hypothetical protein CR161_02535 [Prosthecochloris sp. ZM]|nr:hypothetical protein CR161_02535 [Prosthecochloris sp. ZM]
MTKISEHTKLGRRCKRGFFNFFVEEIQKTATYGIAGMSGKTIAPSPRRYVAKSPRRNYLHSSTFTTKEIAK